jgi:hypothetical protein
MPRSLIGIALLAASAGAGGGCRGTIGPGGSGAGGTGAAGASGGSPSALLPARIRRLTNAEYDASVQALLGTAQTPAASTFPPDARQGGFSLNDAQRVDPVLAKQLSAAADALATEAAANGTLARLAPCADPTAGLACAKTFIQTFGAAAYRRPLTDAEASDLAALYTAGADGATYLDGIGLVVRGALQSAGFLYLTELGDSAAPPPAAPFELGDFEAASALSFIVAAGPPDADLLAAARAGQLAAPDAREAQARRLLATPAARTRLVRVVREWLGIDGIAGVAKDTTVYPGFAALRPSMDAESVAFIGEVARAGGDMLGALLGADWSVVDAPLASAYGVAPGADTSAGGAPRTPLGGRRGILNQGAFLSIFAHASETAPVLRGVAVMRRVACLDVPSPTSLNIVVTPPVPDPTKTTRQRFSVHATDAVCAACHNNIDAFGFAFEGRDAMGRARTTDANQPVDTSTVVMAGTDFDGAYADSDALAAALAGSADVRACVARQLFRASAGRSDASVAAAEASFVDAWRTTAAGPTVQGNLVETIVAFVRSPLFTRRQGP